MKPSLLPHPPKALPFTRPRILVISCRHEVQLRRLPYQVSCVIPSHPTPRVASRYPRRSSRCTSFLMMAMAIPFWGFLILRVLSSGFVAGLTMILVFQTVLLCLELICISSPLPLLAHHNVLPPEQMLRPPSYFRGPETSYHRMPHAPSGIIPPLLRLNIRSIFF